MSIELENSILHINHNLTGYLDGWQQFIGTFPYCVPATAEIFIDINDQDVIPGTDTAVVEILDSTCFKPLKIYNKQTDRAIINFGSYSGDVLGNISIANAPAELILVGTGGFNLKNITTENVLKISIISRAYKGLDGQGNLLFGDYGTLPITIENYSGANLHIDGIGLMLSGDLQAESYGIFLTTSTLLSTFGINAAKLNSLAGPALIINDTSGSNGVYLSGQYQVDSKIDISTLNNLYLDQNTKLASKDSLSINVLHVARNDGNVVASNQLIVTGNHFVNNGNVFSEALAKIYINGVLEQKGTVTSNTGIILTTQIILNDGGILGKTIHFDTDKDFSNNGSITANAVTSLIKGIFILNGNITAGMININAGKCNFASKTNLITAPFTENNTTMPAGDTIIMCGDQLSMFDGGSIASGQALLINSTGPVVVSGNVTSTTGLQLIGQSIINNGNIVGNNITFYGTDGPLINNHLIIGDNILFNISNGNFQTNSLINATNQVIWYLGTNNSVFFNNGSITDIGSFIFSTFDKDKVAEVKCIGFCFFNAKDKSATNIISANLLNVTDIWYKKSSGKPNPKDYSWWVRNDRYRDAIGARHSEEIWDNGKSYLYIDTHSRGWPANFIVAGNVDFRVNKIESYLSNIIIEGSGSFFESNATVLIKGEAVTSYVTMDQNVCGKYTAKTIAEDRGLVNFTVNGCVATQVTSKFNSIFYVRNATGEIANLIALGMSTGNKVPELAGSESIALPSSVMDMLALVKSNGLNNIELFKNSGPKSISFTTKNGDVITSTTINLEEFAKHSNGLDIGLLLRFMPLNPQIYQSNPLNAQAIGDGNSESGYSLHFLRRIDPIIAHFSQSPLNPEQFLADIAFKASGIVSVNMDGHLLWLTAGQAAGTMFGRLYGMDNTQIARQLMLNAIEYHAVHPDEIPGQPLIKFNPQIDRPMLWPVYTDCTDLGAKECLSFVFHYSTESIINAIEGASFSTEVADLKVKNNVLVDSLGQIKVGQSLKLSVAGHVINLGQIEGGTQEWDVKGNFINAGSIKTASDLVISALNVVLIGTIDSGAKLTANATQQMVLKTLHTITQYSDSYSNTVRQHITQQTTIGAKGELSLIAGSDVTVEGIDLKGGTIFLKSTNGKVSVVPITLYNEATTWGRKFYYSYKSLSLHRSTLESTVGGIEIESGAGTLLSGMLVKSADNTTIKTIGTTIVESPSEYVQITSWHKKKQGGLAGAFGGTKTTSIGNFFSNIKQTVVETVGHLLSSSTEDQYWIGADMKVYSAELRAGTAEREAAINLLSAQEIKEVKVVTKTRGFSFKCHGGMLNVASSVNKEESERTITQIPTIFQIKDKFIGYTNGKWKMLSSKILSDGSVEIDAKDIELGAAPDVKVSYAKLDETGYGIGFSRGVGEFAIKAALWKERSGEMTAEQRYNSVSTILANLIKIKGDTFTTFGAYLDAAKMDINARITFFGVLKDTITHSTSHEAFEASLKLGIKSNIGQIFEGTKGIANQDYSSPEGYVNSAFAANTLYDNMLTLLSKKENHGISGGLWIHGSYANERSSTTVTEPVPTIIRVSELLNSTSDELRLVGTQINAYNAYIKTKYLEGRNTEYEVIGSSSKQDFDMDIPLTANAPAGFNAFISKANQYQKVVLNANIVIAGHLDMEVEGHADLRGVYLSAKSLDAFFESLLLESVQDIIKNKNDFGIFGIGFSQDAVNKLSLGFQTDRHNKHAVERISVILGGTDMANVVVANALRLNGAMIASAQRDPVTGKYTDHGNLVLKVGEFFIQHIQDYDKGYTLGASVTLMQSKEGEKYFGPASARMCGFKYEGTTYATVGQGDIKVEKGEIPADLNRDANNAQTREKIYDIDQINGEISGNKPEPKPKDDDVINNKDHKPKSEPKDDGIFRDKAGNIDLKATAESIFSTASSTVGEGIDALKKGAGSIKEFFDEVNPFSKKVEEKARAANDNEFKEQARKYHEEVTEEEDVIDLDDTANDDREEPATEDDLDPDLKKVLGLDDNKKGRRIYEAPIGPKEAFMEQYEAVEKEIEKMPISEVERERTLGQLYYLMKEISRLDTAGLDKLKAQLQERHKSIGQKNILENVWSYVSNLVAEDEVNLGVLASEACVASKTCSSFLDNDFSVFTKQQASEDTKPNAKNTKSYEHYEAFYNQDYDDADDDWGDIIELDEEAYYEVYGLPKGYDLKLKSMLQTVEEDAKSQNTLRINQQKNAIFRELIEDMQKVSGEYLIFQQADQIYITSMYFKDVVVVAGKKEFAETFPNAYGTMAALSDKVGEFIVGTIDKVDGKFTEIIGERYTRFKTGTAAVLETLDKHTPEFVKDGVIVIGAGKVSNAIAQKFINKAYIEKEMYLDNDIDLPKSTGYKEKIYSNQHVDVGDINNPRVLGPAKLLPDTIPTGRIDYSVGFINDLENFMPSTSKLHNGKLDNDLYLVNYHDGAKELGLGKGKRTISWATHIEVGNRMLTMEDVYQHLALVKPDWGSRNSVSLIKIPKGTDTTFISGKAMEQVSDITGQVFKGGGYQVRFRDFDEKWILQTRKIGKTE